MSSQTNWVHDVVKASLLLSAIQTSKNTISSIGALLAYEQVTKILPTLTQSVHGFFNPVPQLTVGLGKAEATATITCQKAFDSRNVQPSNRVDAILQYIATLKQTTSLTYNGLEYIPDVQSPVQIESDIYFLVLRKDEDAKGALSYIQFQLLSFEHDVQFLQRFIESCLSQMEKRIRNKLGSNLYYFDQIVDKLNQSTNQNFVLFRKNLFHTTRTFSNVFFEERDMVKERVQFFKTRKDWYDTKGIPYTLGFMFGGPAGTGKSSTIKTIANEMQRHVFEVKLSDIKSNSQLKHLFYNEEVMVVDPISQKTESLCIPISERLYVIEDIDAMKSVVLSRKSEGAKTTLDLPAQDEESDKAPNSYAEFMSMPNAPRRKEAVPDPLDLSTLLNILDGTLEIPGRIICITSNYPERLDDALVRPGRIDMNIQFKKCNATILAQICNSFYSELGHVFRTEEFSDIEYRWTPAEVNQILFQNFTTPQLALQRLTA